MLFNDREISLFWVHFRANGSGFRLKSHLFVCLTQRNRLNMNFNLTSKMPLLTFVWWVFFVDYSTFLSNLNRSKHSFQNLSFFLFYVWIHTFSFTELNKWKSVGSKLHIDLNWAFSHIWSRATWKPTHVHSKKKTASLSITDSTSFCLGPLITDLFVWVIK